LNEAIEKNKIEQSWYRCSDFVKFSQIQHVVFWGIRPKATNNRQNAHCVIPNKGHNLGSVFLHNLDNTVAELCLRTLINVLLNLNAVTLIITNFFSPASPMLAALVMEISTQIHHLISDFNVKSIN